MSRGLFWAMVRSSFSGSVYDTEPANQPTSFAAMPTSSTAILVSFTSSIGDPLPTSYLVLGKKQSGSFPSVSDGVAIADESDISTGYVAKNISYLPANITFEFTGLDTDETYDFVIYAYRGTGATINYKTDSAPTDSAILTGFDDLILDTEPLFWVRGDAITDKTGNFTASAVNTPTVTSAVINGRDVIRNVRADNDGIDIGSLGTVTEFFIAAFFKANGTSDNQRIMDCVSTAASYASNGFNLAIITNALVVQLRKISNNRAFSVAFTDTGWNFVTARLVQEGSTWRITMKLNGVRALDEITNAGIDSPVNPMRLLSDKHNTDNLTFDGDAAELFMWNRKITRAEEALLYNYINNYYATSYVLDNTDVTFSGLNFIESLGIRTNGIDYYDTGSKKNIFFGDLDGKIYHSVQGATLNDAWTTTEIIDTGDEISSLRAYDIDDDGIIELVTLHKLAAGSIQVHKPDSSNYSSATWTSTTVRSAQWPQDLEIKFIDSNYNLVDEDDPAMAKPVIFFSEQGTTLGEGGIGYVEYNGGGFNNAANWNDQVIYQHESAWAIAGFYDISGNGYNGDIVFSARNARNDSSLPGIYYLTVNASGDIRDSWTRTTINDDVADWLHVVVGNFFGNEFDIASIRLGNSTIYLWDSGNAYAQTTITGPGSASYNLAVIQQQEENGRSSLFHVVENQFSYRVYIQPTGTWYKQRLWPVTGHPFDNEVYTVNLDNKGPFEILFDDSTYPSGKVSWFRLLIE